MFDKLIVSDERGAEFRGRSRYFMVSTVVVGILFVTALVFSLYATDIGLGNDDFELSMMLAPVTPEAPDPPKPEVARDQTSSSQSDVPTRIHNIQRPEESPTDIPKSISVTPNPFQSRPPGRFDIGRSDTPGAGAPGEPGSPRGESSSGGGTGSSTEPVAELVKIPDPPPVIKPKPPSPPISIGVANGKATHLPKPPYPQAAIAVRVEGEVSVQVTIDETGKVVSAKVAKGHPLLRAAAENAAWRARFTPTTLSNVPVKVTGVIVYNFKRS